MKVRKADKCDTERIPKPPKQTNRKAGFQDRERLKIKVPWFCYPTIQRHRSDTKKSKPQIIIHF